MLAVLAGCATRAPAPADRDGPQPNPPAELARVPDAVPRVEPIRVGGPNKPYEVLGERYLPLTGDDPYLDRGLASWYGRKFHGRPTASGERLRHARDDGCAQDAALAQLRARAQPGQRARGGRCASTTAGLSSTGV